MSLDLPDPFIHDEPQIDRIAPARGVAIGIWVSTILWCAICAAAAWWVA